jgi:glycerate kinase
VPVLLAAPDKFRGTATAAEAAEAMADAARSAGWDAVELPLSDGGEGLLDCLGGPNLTSTVTGPLGAPVAAGWRLAGSRAVVELAAASGLALVAGRNDPLAATSRGTGELVRRAIEAGAREVVVGAGGSACTDGGWGAVEVLADLAPLDGSRGVRVSVLVDVRTRFLDAATVFGPQKGADPAQVRLLVERLRDLALRYRERFGVDVTGLAGSGAAGGFAGGLAALGATIRPGFPVVAEQLGLPDAVSAADLVVTGEGRFDPPSLQGKVTGSVAELATQRGRPVAVLAGEVAAGFAAPYRVVDLTAEYGSAAARSRTLECLCAATRTLLADLPGR